MGEHSDRYGGKTAGEVGAGVPIRNVSGVRDMSLLVGTVVVGGLFWTLVTSTGATEPYAVGASGWHTNLCWLGAGASGGNSVWGLGAACLAELDLVKRGMGQARPYS